MIADDSWGWAEPGLLQRAAHLAALRILVDARRAELERIVVATDALACAGYVLDRDDPEARVQHGRRTQQLARRAKAAEFELHAAETALRAAVLDDGWTPADDLGGSPTA